MLRPANLLPPKRLLTPRLGQKALAYRLGPATRHFGAYRDGTLTRWTGTAWLDALRPTAARRFAFRTHHPPRLAAARDLDAFRGRRRSRDSRRGGE